MPQPTDELAEELRLLIQPGARERLVARGLARGMIWRGGELPTGAQTFARSLTADLLDHGYLILAKALQLKETGEHADMVEDAFRVAAESIESAVRRGDPQADGQGFHLVVSACAFHLAHLAARSYCLVPARTDGLNLSSPERVLVALMRRDLRGMREIVLRWLSDTRHTDAGVAARLAAELEPEAEETIQEFEDREDDEADVPEPFGIQDAIATAITRRIMQGLARFEFALRSGAGQEHEGALVALDSAAQAAGRGGFVTLWWAATLARHLIDELWGYSLHVRLPRGGGPVGGAFDQIRGRFIRLLSSRNVSEIDLWPSQLEAARRAVEPHDDLVVALPTSAGKTRIAELCILRALADGLRVVYVTPLRALSAQLERTLGRTFRPLGFTVSSLYGASGVTLEDVRTLRSAQIVVSTPEKLDFSMRQEPAVLDDVALIVLDEGHMIGESSREVRYEVLVQRLLSRPDAGTRRIVCLSAIFSAGESFSDFTEWLRSDEPGDPIESKWRPTRQRSAVLERLGANGLLRVEVDGETPFVPQFVRPVPPPQPPRSRRRNAFPNDPQEYTIATALALVNDQHRVLVYCTLRASVESLGRTCLDLHRFGFLNSFANRPAALSRALHLASEWLGDEHTVTKALQIGIGLHHGGLPRPFLAEVERLMTERVLPIVIASPTVAQGLDLSCSALVLHSIHRAGSVIEAKEYANVIGRAGRAFVDLDGLTVYPVFERGAEGQRRIRTYKALRQSAQERQMESGILLLIEHIAQELCERMECGVPELLEYVLNHGGSWEDVGPAPDGEKDGLPELLANLDTAILSTVEDLHCATEDLADILDAALRTSLWRRRLDRKPADYAETQRSVLRGRARWLWSNSGAVERRACFAAGVGHATGVFIFEHLDALLADLVVAEAALTEGDPDTAVESVTRAAAVLFRSHPFVVKLPVGWERVLEGWLRGTPTSALVGKAGGEEIGLIQDAFVYRLVWAVETVRVHAVARNDERVILLAGTLPLALTYGLPTVQGNLLAQAGLASRAMVVRLLEAFPAHFTTGDEIVPWLADVAARLPEDFWPDEPSMALWLAFTDTSRAVSAGRWVETESRYEVRWAEGVDEPAPGASIQIAFGNVPGEAAVYTPDLTRLGVVAELDLNVLDGHTTAFVDAEPGRIVMRRFAPVQFARRPEPN